jgi:transposase
MLKLSAKENGGAYYIMKHGGARPGAGRPKKEYQMLLFPQPTEKRPLPITERNLFTVEQIDALRSSPYVRKVTSKTASYTLEFKEIFWKQYNSGISPPQIFADAGFDLEVLGDQRIYGLLTTLRRTKERGVPFVDGREPREPGKQVKRNEGENPQAPPPTNQQISNISASDIRKLMHQVTFLTQEMAFLKKIFSAGMGEKSK